MTADCGDAGQATIDVLPDDVLLDIFDFCLDRPRELYVDTIKTWQRLVHVCGRWRDIIFQSPRRLNLQILCTVRTPVKEMLGIWPALPLTILAGYYPPTRSTENITSALEHRDRTHKISIGSPSISLLESLLSMMQEPFPVLTSLNLLLYGRIASRTRIPDSFLGGSAPHLRYLSLENVSYPALPALLLSATNLVTLSLQNVPHSGYISPEAMVTCLLQMTKLESLKLKFQSSRFCHGRESQYSSLPTRVVLPVLTSFEFRGVSEYLEVLVARIHAPLLNYFEITFFSEAVFHTSHLSEFIGRVPKFRALKEARVVFSGGNVSVRVPSESPTQPLGYTVLTMGISHKVPNWWPSSVARLFTSAFPPFLTVEHLYMRLPPAHWQVTEDSDWMELLHPFAAVKNLYLSKKVGLRIAPALQELAFDERLTEELPALQNIFLADLQPTGSVQQAINYFAYTRWLSGQPVAVFQWEVEKSNRWEICEA
jgi:F-box-like